jgi:multiple sugar transport system permease protein
VTRRDVAGRVAVYGGVAVVLAVVLFPFWWMVVTSLKPPVDIFAGVDIWPDRVTLDNYRLLFDEHHFRDYLVNSVTVVAISVAVSLVLGTLAAFAITRFRLRLGLNQTALVVALLVRMVPPILLVIPLYIILVKWSLVDTRLGLILVYSGLNTSFVIWMMQSFLDEIPREIEEAALVDGDSRLGSLRRVVLPLAAPGLAATAIFSVIATYNDFLLALSFTQTPDAQTVPVGVSTLIGKIQIEWGPMAAAGVVGAAPIVAFALIVQRHFVRGLTLGAVK